MKKILLTSAIILTVLTSMFAQPCTPGAYTNSGIYPDSVPGLPPAYINAPYSTVITVVVPTDTILFSVPLTIDSIGIIAVTGLPAGFAYTGNPANGYIQGGASGCVVITGTPTLAQIGSYPIDITTDSWVNGMTQGFPETKTAYYTIHILDTLVSITQRDNIEQAPSNYPNPFSRSTNISFYATSNGVSIFQVYNCLGQMIEEQLVNCTLGKNTFTFERQMPDGIYFYRLNGVVNTGFHKMSIQH